MFEIKGETRGEYFHVLCTQCEKHVTLSNLRWVGGVPEIDAECKEHGSDNFKLQPAQWARAMPPNSN